MNTPSEETLRVKSSGSVGGKNRQISIGIKTYGKSSGEEVNSVPNYLRASTGSCHDICKYGKHYEHLNSDIPIKFAKEKVAKTVVPVERKKTTTVKPSPVMVNRDVSARSNVRVKKKEIKTVKKAEATRKTCLAKKLIPKATLTDSRSQKASLSRAESLKATKSESAKKVAPLKDQNWMQKSEPEQTSSDKVQTQALHDGKAESEVYIESIKFDFIYSSMELKDPLACDSSLVQIEALDGFETKPEVKLKTMEFDFILPSMELVDPPVYNESEPFSCNDKLPKNSTIMPMVIESSYASSNKEVSEESLIAPLVSESTQYEGVLEDESEYTDDHNEEVEVSEDNEKEIVAAQNDEMETTARVQDKVRRKGRGVIFEDKDDKGVKLKFRTGKVLDIHQSENNDFKNGRKSVFLSINVSRKRKMLTGCGITSLKKQRANSPRRQTLFHVMSYVGRQVSSVNVVDIKDFCLHNLKDMVVKLGYGVTDLIYYHFLRPRLGLGYGLHPLNVDADVLEMAKYVKDNKIILVYVEIGISNVDSSIFVIPKKEVAIAVDNHLRKPPIEIDSSPDVNRNLTPMYVERLIVVESVDHIDGLDEILCDYANTRQEITRKQMIVHVDNESKEESDMEENDTNGINSEDLDYDPKHDEVFDDDEHIVKDVPMSMNNFNFIPYPKHGLSIGGVKVQDHDLDIVEYDSFGNDLEGGIDYERRIQLRELKRIGKKKNKGPNKYYFYLGQQFATKEIMTGSVRKHSVKTRRKLIMVKNDKERVRVRCEGTISALVSYVASDTSMGKYVFSQTKGDPFIKSPWPGQRLTAVGVDANNEIYPVAYVIVEAKSKASWDLIQAIASMFPSAEYKYYVRHIHENIKSQFKGGVYKTCFRMHPEPLLLLNLTKR
uniref:Putative calmodulin-binding domain, plant n=1 Tax=Tanacetum cinerariifolium TaxID=118510 RepID=A0A6L2M8P9_TANCI|nr:putative calmodulin-binding domain, plant [Tanacetum cinerariifolium]